MDDREDLTGTAPKRTAGTAKRAKVQEEEKTAAAAQKRSDQRHDADATRINKALTELRAKRQQEEQTRKSDLIKSRSSKNQAGEKLTTEIVNERTRINSDKVNQRIRENDRKVQQIRVSKTLMDRDR